MQSNTQISTQIPPFWGMIIYEKIGEGCLNGAWNNNDPNGHYKIHNEIARKSDGHPEAIDGEYSVAWIEGNNKTIIGKLIVIPINNNKAFSFEWLEKDSSIFTGAGIEINTRQIAVTYWESDPGTITFPVLP
jgi:hypothetical protein